MSAAMQELLAILDLEKLEHNLFRGRSPKVGLAARVRRPDHRPGAGRGAAHGRAATATCIRCTAISCGRAIPTVPIVYEVDRIRDGGSFTTRRVVAIQHGQAIFSLSASFQVDEDGLEHQIADAARRAGAGDAAGRSSELLGKFGDAVPGRHPPLLGARPADRDAAGDR